MCHYFSPLYLYVVYQNFYEKFDKIILDAPCSGSSMFRKNKLAKDDYLFIGIIDGIKTVFGNITNGYLSFYERCKTDNISLTDNDIQYLLNIQHFKKKYITDT